MGPGQGPGPDPEDEPRPGGWVEPQVRLGVTNSATSSAIRPSRNVAIARPSRIRAHPGRPGARGAGPAPPRTARRRGRGGRGSCRGSRPSPGREHTRPGRDRPRRPPPRRRNPPRRARRGTSRTAGSTSSASAAPTSAGSRSSRVGAGRTMRNRSRVRNCARHRTSSTPSRGRCGRARPRGRSSTPGHRTPVGARRWVVGDEPVVVVDWGARPTTRRADDHADHSGRA